MVTLSAKVFFSVVTINYNNRNGLVSTLKSVSSQINDNFEFIVVDGGSDDGSLEELTNFELDCKFSVKIISEKDDGLYYAMNKGLRECTGKYIVFMNSGDEFYDSNTLDNIQSKMTSDVDFLYGDCIDVLPKGGHYRTARPIEWHKKGMITSHQAMYFNRSLIAEHNLKYNTDFKFAADYDFISKFIMLSKCNSYMNLPLCKFDLSGVSNSNRLLALRENYKIRVDVLGMSVFMAGMLYLAHYLHTILKNKLPSISRLLRRSVAHDM